MKLIKSIAILYLIIIFQLNPYDVHGINMIVMNPLNFNGIDRIYIESI